MMPWYDEQHEDDNSDIDVGAFIELLTMGTNSLKEALAIVVDKHALGLCDQQGLEEFLTDVGHAVLRSSGEDRPLTVKVAFE